MMKRPVLLAALAFASIASAQRGPLPGIPLVPPPVNHPALIAQPLMQPDSGKTKPAPAKPAKKAAQRKRPKIDPATVGPKASGKILKRRIAKVTDLKWGKNLFELKARSAATGKPILYLQALGTLSGYA